ncbi:MAG: hypothetical protein SRB2_00062 [Desulfobacteraceae bacterium Eth-SRB2]|nr:MAG: hypothetical protein SRB2_00062 [Desulfobacteraceae bacterium Eth-SRB2]
MIHFDPPPEPAHFDEMVRQPGLQWLEAHRVKAEYTLHRLHLRDDERVIRQRREWYRMYQDGELNIEGLRKKAPLIARAIEREQAENQLVMG